MSAVSFAIVGCAKRKGAAPAPARDLYTSSLFRLSLAFAEAHAPRVLIASAYYGLLAPSTVIEPYDQQLSDLSPEQQRAWAVRLVAELGPRSNDPRPALLLAGGLYARLLQEELVRAGWEVEAPLAGLQIGQRLHWLSCSALERATRVPAERWGS